MSGNVALGTGGKTVGYYTPVVTTAPDAGLAFLSGVLSVDPDGVSVGVGDFETQMRQVFTILGQTLEAAGSTWRDLVKMTTYLVDPDHVAPFYAVREVIFKDYFPEGRPPGNTLLIVQRLVRPEFLIEVEGVATTTRTKGDADELVG